jgi:hypothetical protein
MSPPAPGPLMTNLFLEQALTRFQSKVYLLRALDGSAALVQNADLPKGVINPPLGHVRISQLDS